MFMTEIIFVLGPNSLDSLSLIHVNVDFDPSHHTTHHKQILVSLLNFFLPSVYLHYELIKPHFSIFTTLSFYLSSSHLRKIQIAFPAPQCHRRTMLCRMWWGFAWLSTHSTIISLSTLHQIELAKCAHRNLKQWKKRVKIALLSTWVPTLTLHINKIP